MSSKRRVAETIGGVAPVGHPEPLRTIVDIALSNYDVVWAAGGHPHCVFPTNYGELLLITGGEAAEVGTKEQRPRSRLSRTCTIKPREVLPDLVNGIQRLSSQRRREVIRRRWFATHKITRTIPVLGRRRVLHNQKATPAAEYRGVSGITRRFRSHRQRRPRRSFEAAARHRPLA